MSGRMKLDTKKIVLEELFFVLIVNILLTINKKSTIILPRSMHLQFPSSQRFVLLVNKSSQVTTLSNIIGNYGNPVIL